MLQIFRARRARLFTAFAALTVVTFYGASPALAGFEWVTGAQDTQKQDALAPLPGMHGDDQPARQAPRPGADHVLRLPEDYQVQGVPGQVQREALPQAASLPQEKVEITATLPAQDTAPGIVQGFGDDIPLALALQQLVPPGYTYSFAVSINPGLRVSWNDGRPWEETINAMLSVHGLRADVQGKNVRIEHQGDGAANAAVTLSPPRSNEIIFDDTQGRVIHRANIADPGQQPPLALHSPEPLAPMPQADFMSARDLQTPSIKGEEIIYLLPPEVEPDVMQARAAPAAGVDFWEAAKGQSVRETLEAWTKTAGVSLRWEASHDYRLNNSIMVSDRFTAALKAMLEDGLDPQNRPVMRYIAGNSEKEPATLIVQDARRRT